MKKTAFILTFLLLHIISDAQNPPVIEKAAPKSNNLLPSNGTLGSNSGVNPAGNPGTIINYSANSNSINNKLAPNPNVEKGVYLSSSPEGTVYTTTVTTGQSTTETTTAVSNGAATTIVSEPVRQPAATINREPLPEPVKSPMVTTITETPKTPQYKPVLSNYIPAEVVKQINEKYGSSVYDITTMRNNKTKNIVYLVRLSDNGVFRSVLFEPK
ncbi:MAG: hypothetical protein JST81_01325 [Bacteroidetes bacterium]|nr:hypothetical protein [Bacteroidota bacterium]